MGGAFFRVFAFGLLLFSLGLAQAAPFVQSAGPAGQVSTVSEGVPYDRLRVVYNLVHENWRVSAYDGAKNRRVQNGLPFDKAVLNDDSADLRFIVFDSVSLIDALDDQALQQLLDQFEEGDLVIGARGFGKDLKESLGLLDPSLADATTTTGGDDLWVLLHRSPAGHLNELVVGVPNRRDLTVWDNFEYLRDWYNRNQTFVDTAVTDGDNPWQAIHNYEWSGNTTGKFDDSTQQVGTYKYTLSLYWVDSDDDDSDWYRADFQTISEITNYKMTGNKFGDTKGKCGWWTEDMHAVATVTTPGGQWFEFMPSSTVGSTTTSFTIGGSITTAQAGVNAGYSQSYGEPDVTISVEANSVAQSIDWKASLVGCHNYSYYPDYAGASKVAKTTYNLNPSFIIQVPEGKNMAITTNAGSSDPWRFTVRKDRIKLCKSDSEVCVNEHKSTYEINKSVTCTPTSCS